MLLFVYCLLYFQGCLEDPFILLDFGPEQISGLLSEVCGTPPVNPDDEVCLRNV